MNTPSPQGLLPLLGLGLLALPWEAATAAAPAFQDFLFQACNTSTDQLAVRCGESDNGDLSGDSESSLNPTQSLSNGEAALLETRNRIQALQEKQRERRNQEKYLAEGKLDTGTAMTVFQMSGLSLLVNVQGTYIERDASQLERGYDTDSVKLQLGADYRITDDWTVGALLGISRDKTKFDGANPGVNFNPGSSEGRSEADRIGLNLFSTANLSESIYVQGLASYSHVDYTFKRFGIFQNSQRNPLLNEDVRTSSDTNGYDFSVGVGAGMEIPLGEYNSTVYTNVDYQKVSVDDYQEDGGAGFAMSFDSESTDHTLGTLGVNLSRAFNSSYAVWVPQVFVQYEYLFNDSDSSSTSRFLEDTSGTRYNLTGDSPDDSVIRAGLSLLAVRPNGWLGYLQASTVQEQKNFDQYQVSLGIRVEY